jgi:site-specific recombinase XerD
MTTRSQSNDFAALLQRFFVERLIQQRNASPRTVESYRDSFRLLLSFAQQTLHKPPVMLTLEDLDPVLITGFLDHLETARGNCVRSRNARLAAIHAFYRYVSLQYPQALRLAQQVLAIPVKRFEKPLLGFLSIEEMRAVLAAPDTSRWAGQRDQVMFALLYNTGARVSELINIRVQDVQLDTRPSSVRLHGKGRKQRTIPLWQETAGRVRNWVKEQALKPEQLLFANRFGNKLTRAAVAARMALAVVAATKCCPQLRGRHITCHTVRHATAMHLLQGGVDITVMALWLGHESPVTTHGYVEADLRMKQQALKAVASPGTRSTRFKAKDDLLRFLESL